MNCRRWQGHYEGRVAYERGRHFNANWNSGRYFETGFFSCPNVQARFADEVTGEEFDTGVPTGTAEHDNARILSLTYPFWVVAQ